MEIGVSPSMKALPRRYASPRMGKLQELIDCWIFQLCLFALAASHSAAYIVLGDESLKSGVNACELLNVTGWLVVGMTSSEFLIRIMAQAGHIYLLTSWRRFLRPLYHKVDFFMLVVMLARMITRIVDCEREDAVEPTDRFTIFVVLAYRFIRCWGILYDVSTWATETILLRTNRLHTKRVRLDEALWPEDFREQRRLYNSRSAVRMQDFLNTRTMQAPICIMLLVHCVFYVVAMEYAFPWGVSWIIEAVEVTGCLALVVLLAEFMVRCIAREGELFFDPLLHKAEALFLCVGSFLVLYATLNNRWMRAGRGGWEPNAWAILSILIFHRILRFFGIALDVSESEYGVSSVLDAKAIKIFLGFVGSILEISPQNVHFKIPSPTQTDIEVWIMKASLKATAFESLHLPITLHGGLVEELFVRLPRPRILRKGEDDDSLVTNVRVQNLLVVLGPGGGLAEAGGCSDIHKDRGYWFYENILETKWRLVELISRHLRYFVHEDNHAIHDDSDISELTRSIDNEWKQGVSRREGETRSRKTMSPEEKRRRASTRFTKMQQKFHSRLESMKKNFQRLFKDLSLSHIYVSVDNVMLQYEDTGTGFCNRRASVGIKVGNISISRHQDHHITCDATRFKVLMMVDRSKDNHPDEDVGFWWESSKRRLSALLRQHPGDALRQMKRVDRREWFRSWCFEALDRQRPRSDRQLHQRIESWPERHEVISFLKVSVVGRPKEIIRFYIEGELHIATILAVRECRCNDCRQRKRLDSLPEEVTNPEKHVMTHQIRLLVGGSGERWVCLDYDSHTLSDDMGNTGIHFIGTASVVSKDRTSLGVSDTMVAESSWITLHNSNDVRHKSRRHSAVILEKNAAPRRKTIVQTFRKSLWSTKHEKSLKLPMRSWVYSVETTPIHLTCDNDQICYLNDWRYCLKAWYDHDNAFRWRPDVQALPDEERSGVQSMTARLWWIYATHRVLAQRGMRFQAPGLLEVAWRSVNYKKYSELLAEVAKRSVGNYSAMQWQPSELALARELQVRLTVGSVVEARRNVLQDVLKLARERELRRFESRYGMLASLKPDQGLWEDVAQKAAEKAEEVQLGVEHLVEAAQDVQVEAAHRMQEVGEAVNMNLKSMRTSMERTMSDFASSKPRRRIRFIHFDSATSEAGYDQRESLRSPSNKLKSFFGFGKTKTRCGSSDAHSRDSTGVLVNDDSVLSLSSQVLSRSNSPGSPLEAHRSSKYSNAVHTVASSFLPWRESATSNSSPSSSRSSSLSGDSETGSLSEGAKYHSEQINSGEATPSSLEEHGVIANLAGEWQIRVQGVHVKLLRSCCIPTPRPVIVNAKLSGLVLDLGVLLPRRLDAFDIRKLTSAIEQEYASLHLFPYTGLFVIHDMSVVCPDAKKLTLYGRRDLCNIVRSLGLPEHQPRFLSGGKHSALMPMPGALVLAAHMSMTPSGEEAGCKVMMHSADMWFVLYEPVLKIFWEFLGASEIPSCRHRVFASSFGQPNVKKDYSFDVTKSLLPSTHSRKSGILVAFDRRFGPLGTQLEIDIEMPASRTPQSIDRERHKGMVRKQRFFERLVGKMEYMLNLAFDINLGALHVAQVGSYLKPDFVLVEEYRIHPCSHRACRGEVESSDDAKQSVASSVASSRKSANVESTSLTVYDSMKYMSKNVPSFQRSVIFESKDFPSTSLVSWDADLWRSDARRMSEAIRNRFEDSSFVFDPSLRSVGRRSPYMRVSFQGDATAKVQSSRARKYSQDALDDIVVQENAELRHVSPHVCDASATCSITVSAQVPTGFVTQNGRITENLYQNDAPIAESRHARSISETALCCCTRDPKASQITARRDREPFWLLSMLPRRTHDGRSLSCYADSRHSSRDRKSSPVSAGRRQLPAPPASRWRAFEFCNSGVVQSDLEERTVRSTNDESMHLPGPPQCVYSISSDSSSDSPQGFEGILHTDWPCAEMLVRVISSKEFASGWLEREALSWCLHAGRGGTP